MSGSFLLMMFLYLWLMLLLVISWITATHFSGSSPSSIYVNYSASKTVLPELYQTPVDTPALLLMKLHRLLVEQCTVFKTATLVYKFLHTGFPRYFAPYLSSYSSSYSTRRSQSGGNFLVTPKFINLSNSLVIVLFLMLPVFGMLFQMRFVPHPP